MSETVVMGLFSLLGTLVGTLGGIMASSSLTNYRIKQLEAKVDKHNNFASRMKAIETMGITNIPEYQSEKIAKYLHECLEKRKIIRRFE